MCLTAVTSTQTEEIEGEGWKIVYHSENENEFRFLFNPYHNRTARPIPYNTWIERQGNVIHSHDGLYPAGFHIFTTKEDAKNYKTVVSTYNTIVVKVKYKTILAKGNQVIYDLQKLPCVVAQFLYVEKPCA